MSFNTLMAQQPQTLAYALNDSPLGLLAWNAQLLGEDLDPDFALSNVMLYWLTGTAASSARLYYENAHATERPTEPTTVPLGLAAFGGDFSGIRRFAERDHNNIVRWTTFERGGHFAAHKAPAELRSATSGRSTPASSASSPVPGRAALRQPRVRRPSRYQVSISPLPLTEIVPLGSHTNSSSSRSRVARVIWIRPGVPDDSMRLAVLTASPHRSYRKRFRPMTPATTGPELIPTRSSRPRCATPSLRAHGVDHVERHERQRAGMIRPRRRDSRGDHVGVADGLDLLDLVPLGQHVEMAEEVVEDADHLGG